MAANGSSQFLEDSQGEPNYKARLCSFCADAGLEHQLMLREAGWVACNCTAGGRLLPVLWRTARTSRDTRQAAVLSCCCQLLAGWRC